MKHETRSIDAAGRERRETGSALVLALFMTALLSAMGVALLFLAQAEMSMSKASLHVKKAFYEAEAGIEDGRLTLFEGYGLEGLADAMEDAAGDDDEISLDVDNLAPLYDADGNVTGLTGCGDDVPLRGLSSLGDGFYAAFLTNDPVDGVGTTDDSNDRAMITAIGTGPKGAVEIVQAIVEGYEPLPSLPMATIALLGPDPEFESGNSNVSYYNGEDCMGHGDPDVFVPAVGTIGDDAENDAESGVKQPNGPDFESGPDMTTPEDTIADLTDLSDPLVNTELDPVWTDCQALHDMIEGLRAYASFSCSGDGCEMPPDRDADDVTFIDNGGNASWEFDIGTDDPDGGGLLVVTGKLAIHGSRDWSGVILAVGRGEVERYGAGNGVLSGTIVVADIAGPDDIYGTADDCGSGPDGFDSVEYTVDGGGVGGTSFCTEHIGPAIPPGTYKVADFRQR
jgi:hypothetical protein